MKIIFLAISVQEIHYDLTGINCICICFRNSNFIITVCIRIQLVFDLIYPVISSCLI